MDKKYPKVGVGVMIVNDKGEILMGKRSGSHGAGEWSFPGGSVEFGETIFEAIKREAGEETNLEVNNLELIAINDETRYIESDGKHHVVIGFKAKSFAGDLKNNEPDKHVSWSWFAMNKLPSPLFEGTELMIKNYLSHQIYQHE